MDYDSDERLKALDERSELSSLNGGSPTYNNSICVCAVLGLFKEVLNYDDRHTDVTGRTRNTLAAVDVNQFIVEGNGNINYIRSHNLVGCFVIKPL